MYHSVPIHAISFMKQILIKGKELTRNFIIEIYFHGNYKRKLKQNTKSIYYSLQLAGWNITEKNSSDVMVLRQIANI